MTGKILRQKFGPPSKVNGPEMSFRLHLANLVLRLFEKPHLTRATPQELRVAFERKAQLFFHPPKGTVFSRQHLKTPSGSLQLQWVQPAQTSQGGVILYFHGGGYVFGSARSHRAMLAKLASLTGCRACLPDYRLAPEHPFPAALEDARAAYQGLLGQGCRPEDIVLGGDSAGGGLALALLHSLLSQGQTSPAGVFCFSPLTDMTFSGSSLRSNARSDVVLPVCRVREVGQMYLREHGRQDPYVSPLFGVFKGASPVLLTVGDGEILLDDTCRMAQALERDCVDVTCDIRHNHPHVWPILGDWLPEARASLQDTAAFVRRVLDVASNLTAETLPPDVR